MEKQMIISVGREYGSGGHEIAEKLAQKYNLPLYDHNFLDELAEKKNIVNHLLRIFPHGKPIMKVWQRKRS